MNTRPLKTTPQAQQDAIDNIDTKVALILACKARGIRVLAVAGAGAKADPTRLRLVDLSESTVDPLARAVRHRLRREHGIASGVPVLLSTEKPRCKLVPAGEGDGIAAPGDGGGPAPDADTAARMMDYQIVPNFRIRTIPVLGTTPAIFGMAAAGFMLCELAGKPVVGEPLIKLTAKQYAVAAAVLREREAARFGDESGVAVDGDDIVYLLRELWRGFSARNAEGCVLPGGDKGLARSTAGLALTRWDAAKPATVDNLVLLTYEEADAHEATTLEALRAAEPGFVARVERVLGKARREYGY